MTDHVALGFTAIERGDYQEALNIFRRAQEKGKNVRSWTGMGIAFFRLGDPGAARWAFAQALELEPADQQANEWIEKVPRGAEKQATLRRRESRFRAGENFLEIRDQGRWRRFFVKGINLGLGLPGYFPGEYPIRKGTYLAWFRQMGELGVNSVRIYTIHPPAFYEALMTFNKGGGRLFLFQGVWMELPKKGDFRSIEYLEVVHRSIREAVDAVYGGMTLPERPGSPSGIFDTDVSPWTAGFIIGREWESCAVKEFNERQGRDRGNFSGRFLEIRNAAPFDRWIAEITDYLQEYEYSAYRISHPVTVTSWPTLDPFTHTSESRYEDQLVWQGYQPKITGCNENEDMETLDTAAIRSRSGAGFFAMYHVYPYYPDFMNHDFLEVENPYRSYLEMLKVHHGKQPVLIAEFGVPSSRETTHWHRLGWNHGGHDEEAQGHIDGSQMEAIRESGCAGGILFSWFDEWFKRNWVFLPYELPAERKPLWFNIQDAEQNYGLLAAYPGYPGKRVTLTGRRGEWTDTSLLYEKKTAAPAFRFNDRHDASRAILRLAATSDEGFLYLLLEAGGEVKFEQAHYLIGLSTCGGTGEQVLPFGTGARSPVGLTFVIHLAGKERSRILACRAYDKYLNADAGVVAPRDSDLGEWVVIQNITNHRRISKDGKRFYPSHVFSMSALHHGSLDPRSPDYFSLADFRVTGPLIEVRIPWGLINVTDPSSKQVLWIDKSSRTRPSDGIGLIACSWAPSGQGFRARTTGRGTNLTDWLPAPLAADSIKTYRWEGWDCPTYHTFLKKSYFLYREVLAKMPE